MQTVLIKVSNGLQHIYHEIDSQLIFLNFKAGFGNLRFTSYILFCMLGLYMLHTGFFLTTRKQC